MKALGLQLLFGQVQSGREQLEGPDVEHQLLGAALHVRRGRVRRSVPCAARFRVAVAPADERWHPITCRWRRGGHLRARSAVHRLAEGGGQRRSPVSRHVDDALDEGQDEVQFGQCIVVLLLFVSTSLLNKKERVWNKIRTSRSVSSVNSGATKTIGPSTGGEVPKPSGPFHGCSKLGLRWRLQLLAPWLLYSPVALLPE